jgi:hypothetical protein
MSERDWTRKDWIEFYLNQGLDRATAERRAAKMVKEVPGKSAKPGGVALVSEGPLDMRESKGAGTKLTDVSRSSDVVTFSESGGGISPELVSAFKGGFLKQGYPDIEAEKMAVVAARGRR